MLAATLSLALALSVWAGAPRLDSDGAKAWPQLREQAASLGVAAPEAPEIRTSSAKDPAAAPSQAPGAKSAVLLQGFHWLSHQASPWWDVIAAKAPDIAAAGFDFVWLPPSSASASDEGYLPNRWYAQDSKYGAKAQLKQAIAALHSGGVGALADLVLNHRVGTADWADFTDPAWGPEAVCSGDEWPGARGHPDTGLGYGAGRDIDHTQPFVQKDIKDWMNWLKREIGYDGWRYDFARGYGPQYLAMYNDATSPAFAVVEVWDNLDVNNYDAHRKQLCDYLDSVNGRVSAFDFTTKGVLQQAVGSGEYWRLRDSQGKPPGLIGRRPAKAVTFLDNHDTGPSMGRPGQNNWPFPQIEVRSQGGGAYTNGMGQNNWPFPQIEVRSQGGSAHTKGTGQNTWLILQTESRPQSGSAHTRGTGQNNWPFPGDKVMEGYAYILTHPGVPCVYWPHFFDWGLRDEIQALVRLRKSAGINSESQVAILAADQGRYAAVIDGKVAVKIGWLDWSPGPGWTPAASGKNYAVWTK